MEDLCLDNKKFNQEQKEKIDLILCKLVEIRDIFCSDIALGDSLHMCIFRNLGEKDSISAFAMEKTTTFDRTIYRDKSIQVDGKETE